MVTDLVREPRSVLAKQSSKFEPLQRDPAIGLLLKHLRAGCTDREVDRPVRLQQDVEQAEAVGRAAGAGHGEHEIGGGHSKYDIRSAEHPVSSTQDTENHWELLPR